MARWDYEGDRVWKNGVELSKEEIQFIKDENKAFIESVKPCPFCGSKNICVSHSCAFFCYDCGAKGPDVRPTNTITGKVWSQAKLAKWNNRS